MNDSLKSIVFWVLIGLLAIAIGWPGLLFAFGCSSTHSCTGNHLPEMTSIPTLPAATLPAPKVGAEAVSSAAKCRIAAVKLLGAWVDAGYSETETFKFTDIKGVSCTATYQDDVRQLFITPNLWFNAAPACTTCHHADVKKATMFMDLSSYAGILAGSQRKNAEPKGNDILGAGKWDQALLYKMLYAPNGQTQTSNPIRPAMPFGRPATVPADGPVVFAGLPETPAATPAP